MLTSCGNTPCCKRFVAQLGRSGTETHIESIVGQPNEKLFIATEIAMPTVRAEYGFIHTCKSMLHYLHF